MREEGPVFFLAVPWLGGARTWATATFHSVCHRRGPIWTKAETEDLLLCAFHHSGSISRRGHAAFFFLFFYFFLSFSIFFLFLQTSLCCSVQRRHNRHSMATKGSLTPAAAGASSSPPLKDAAPLVQSSDGVVLRRHLRSGEGGNRNCGVISRAQAAGLAAVLRGDSLEGRAAPRC